MTLRPRPRVLAAAALGLLLGACGGSLYSAAGVPLVAANGCDAITQHVCPGLDLTCRGNGDPDHCGTGCDVCGAAPAGGARACLEGGTGAWTCGFTRREPAGQRRQRRKHQRRKQFGSYRIHTAEIR